MGFFSLPNSAGRCTVHTRRHSPATMWLCLGWHSFNNATRRSYFFIFMQLFVPRFIVSVQWFYARKLQPKVAQLWMAKQEVGLSVWRCVRPRILSPSRAVSCSLGQLEQELLESVIGSLAVEWAAYICASSHAHSPFAQFIIVELATSISA